MERFEPKERSIKKKLGLIATGIGAAYYVYAQLSELKKKTRIWSYKSSPKHHLNWDVAFRVATDPVMKIAADGVVTHGWDWIREPAKDYAGRTIPQASHAIKRNNLLKDIIVDSAFGWQNACVLGLDMEKIDKNKVKGWHFAFRFGSEENLTRCKIIIPAADQVKILIGDKPVTVFALDTEGNELPTKTEFPISRRYPKYKNLRLF